MLEMMINVFLYLFCLLLLSFIIFLLLYKVVKIRRKARKIVILNYVELQANQWGEQYESNKNFLYADLFTPIKMSNTGIGNDGSNLIITDYTTNAQWFFKM